MDKYKRYKIKIENKDNKDNVKADDKKQNTPAPGMSTLINSNIGHVPKVPEFENKVIPEDRLPDGLVDLGSGFLLTLAEILDFSEGSDS